MSRIHEALKRAEQERASQGGSAQPNFNPTFVAEPSLENTRTIDSEAATSAPHVATEESAHTSPVLPSFAPFSIEALQARCAMMQWTPDPKTMLFLNGDDNVRGSEEFRTLRSRLYQIREKMALKKILVTSALPKEGKTFTAANLAQVIVRQHGRRVLLIDADLRGPRLHLMFGTPSAPGLSEYLQGGNDEFSIMQRGSLENLFLIPSGREVSNPAELVANGRLKFLLQRLEPLFDWIIIDSPPAVPVSDASLLANSCDGVLMVVRSNATPVDMARKARQEFPDKVLVGVVLNGTNRDTEAYSRYYYEAYEKKGTQVRA